MNGEMLTWSKLSDSKKEVNIQTIGMHAIRREKKGRNIKILLLSQEKKKEYIIYIEAY